MEQSNSERWQRGAKYGEDDWGTKVPQQAGNSEAQPIILARIRKSRQPMATAGKKRRARDSNPQPVTRHLISNHVPNPTKPGKECTSSSLLEQVLEQAKSQPLPGPTPLPLLTSPASHPGQFVAGFCPVSVHPESLATEALRARVASWPVSGKLVPGRTGRRPKAVRAGTTAALAAVRRPAERL